MKKVKKSGSSVYKENLNPQISGQNGENMRKMTLFFFCKGVHLKFPCFFLHEGRILWVIKRLILISLESSSLVKVSPKWGAKMTFLLSSQNLYVKNFFPKITQNVAY